MVLCQDLHRNDPASAPQLARSLGHALAYCSINHAGDSILDPPMDVDYLYVPACRESLLHLLLRLLERRKRSVVDNLYYFANRSDHRNVPERSALPRASTPGHEDN